MNITSISLQRQQREATSTKPSIPPSTVVSVLSALETALRAEVKVHEAALKMPASREEKQSMKEAAPAVLRKQIRDVTTKVVTDAGLTEASLKAAFDYYAYGPSPTKDILNKGNAIKKVIGKHILTKKKLLECLIALHEYQIQIMPECVEAALSAGQPSTPMFMQVLQTKPRVMTDQWVQNELGLTGTTEVVTLAIQEGETDKKFGEAVTSLLAEEGAKIQAAAQQGLQAAIMQQMGLGGMSFG